MLELSSKSEQLIGQFQDIKEGWDCVVRSYGTCIVEGETLWEESTIEDICSTQGDGILSAYLAALKWQHKYHLHMSQRGHRGTWYGTDGETRVWIKCEWIPF